jgi:hypothetical protein
LERLRVYDSYDMLFDVSDVVKLTAHDQLGRISHRVEQDPIELQLDFTWGMPVIAYHQSSRQNRSTKGQLCMKPVTHNFKP